MALDAKCFVAMIALNPPSIKVCDRSPQLRLLGTSRAAIRSTTHLREIRTQAPRRTIARSAGGKFNVGQRLEICLEQSAEHRNRQPESAMAAIAASRFVASPP